MRSNKTEVPCPPLPQPTKMNFPPTTKVRRSARNLKKPGTDYHPRKTYAKPKHGKSKPNRVKLITKRQGVVASKTKPNDAVSSSTPPVFTSIEFPAKKVQASATSFSMPAVMRDQLGHIGPGYKDVRFVRREFVRHTHDLVDVRVELHEIETLLRHTTDLYKDVSSEYRRVDCLRRGVENALLSFYKDDRVLWDGSGLFNDLDRFAWEEFAKEMQECRRELKRKREDDWEDMLMQAEVE